MRKVLATIGMAAVLLLMVAVSSPVSASDVCRDLPSETQAPGTTMAVDLVITLGGADTYMIEDYVPLGWTITAAPGGSISDDLRMVSYSAIGGGSDTTLTYQVAIPSGTSPGTHNFTGIFGIGTGGNMEPITCGDMSVTMSETPVGKTSEDSRDPSQDGAASGGEISTPGSLPTLTPTGTISASEEGETPAPALTPTTTPATTTPVTTSTKKLATKPEMQGVPGFEAIFVIAGLLAVVYLIRRRR